MNTIVVSDEQFDAIIYHLKHHVRFVPFGGGLYQHKNIDSLIWSVSGTGSKFLWSIHDENIKGFRELIIRTEKD